MKFLGKVPNFNFMRTRPHNAVLSAVLVITSIASFIFQGFNLGLDFKGGVQIEIGYGQPVEVNTVRQAIAAAGFDEAVIQHIGSARNVSIRIPLREGISDVVVSQRVVAILKEKTDPRLEVRQQDFVGAKMGAELRDDGGIAMLIVFAGILIYVLIRFEWRSAVAAIIATLHDVIITAGCFSLFQWPFDLTVLAALLAVVGYSLNDTIVVYDRIRENFRKMRKGTALQITNSAMNQTLSRTIMTSFVTLLSLVAIYLVGGEVLQPFALALIIGIVVGTYSSIYVATSAALAMGLERIHLLPAAKENTDKLSDTP
jgi:preprotein translocase subunit SecF